VHQGVENMLLYVLRFTLAEQGLIDSLFGLYYTHRQAQSIGYCQVILLKSLYLVSIRLSNKAKQGYSDSDYLTIL